MQYAPDAVGITIRQLDTLTAGSYLDEHIQYDPIALTAEVMSFVRCRTQVPVILGGFGFTAFARPLFDRLSPDFGVCGEPEPVFSAWSDLLARRNLSAIPNLMFEEDGQIRANPRRFFPPSHRQEYTDAAVAAIEAFYGIARFQGPIPPSIPVELARGCPYACQFCIEPEVKGPSYRIRDLSVVEAELDFLVSRLINSFWLICSEINIGHRSELFLRVAELFIKLRERCGRKLVWSSYYLPRDTPTDALATIWRSGFISMWNDYLPLEPSTLRQARVPYTVDQALQALRTYNRRHESIYANQPRIMSFVLGDCHSSLESLCAMFETLEASGLIEFYDEVKYIEATRYYPALHSGISPKPVLVFPRRLDITLQLNGVNDLERVPDSVNAIEPAYCYAPDLIGALKTPLAVRNFLAFVSTTLLSRRHKNNVDATAFLRLHWSRVLVDYINSVESPIDPDDCVDLVINRRVVPKPVEESAKALLGNVMSRSRPIESLLNPPTNASPIERRAFELANRAVIAWLFSTDQKACSSGGANVGLRELSADTIWQLSSYALHRHLFAVHGSGAQLEGMLRSSASTGTVGNLFRSFVVDFNNVQASLPKRLLLSSSGEKSCGMKLSLSEYV